MATETPNSTETMAHGFSRPMAPLASRFDAAMSAIDERIVTNRATDPDAADEAVAVANVRVDEVVVLIAGTPLTAKADTALALRALAWTVSARSEAEIRGLSSDAENGPDARLLDALLARASAA